jgi:hypothetical protein
MSNHNESDSKEKNSKKEEQTPEKKREAQSFFERRKDRVKSRFTGRNGGEPKGIRMGRENDGKGHSR